jgi:hypothetical protein
MTTRAQERLLATLLRDVLRQEAFESMPDVREALKCRCAHEGVPYDGDVVERALALVGSNTPLVTIAPSSGPRVERRPPDDIGRADAYRIYHTLMQRWQRLNRRPAAS